MLFGEHGGGGEQGDLTTAHDALEGRPDGHFGFTESDVAADEAVHRPSAFHVAFDFGNGAQLIRRFFIHEAIFKFPLPFAVGRMRGPAASLTLGLHRKQS